MYKLLRSLVACATAFLAAGHALASPQASFNAATGLLTMSRVDLSSNVAYTDVVIRIGDFGQIAVGDPSVGERIAFDLDSFTLRLPSVSVDGQPYDKVSLRGLAFTLESIGVQVDAGTSGGYDLDLAITASGIALPAVRIENIDKPASQAEFCSDDVYAQFQQSVQGYSGSWRVTGCSFNGSVGNISAQLTVTSPFAMSLPYSVTYTYSAR
jgi:hypothetical protein